MMEILHLPIMQKHGMLFFYALDDNVTNWISSQITAYDVQEALELAYEGDDTMKEQQLEALQT